MNDFNDKAKHNQTGCLLIHGFGGNLDEIKPLADSLAERGYIVECPPLKGHTGKRHDLKQCTYREWIESAQEGYDKLRVESNTIFLIGFSMGGLIAFQLALKNRVDAVVTLNTPIFYWDLKRVAKNLAQDIRTKKFDHLRKYVNSSIKLPLRAMLNFRMLLSKTKPVLRRIKCPVFTAQALQDDTVHKSSADYIYNNIKSECKKLEFYDGSGHLILWSEAAGTVINDVIEFLAGIACKDN